MAAVAVAAAAGALAAVRANNAKKTYSMYTHESPWHNVPYSPPRRMVDEPLDWITITCLEELYHLGKEVALPRSFGELKKIGATTYGATYVRVSNVQGAEINDIRVVRVWDRVVFSPPKGDEESIARVTITCLEKADVVGEELLVLPHHSLEELKEVGVKKYGASFTRVLSEEGYEINDIRVVRDGDQIVFTRQVEESIVRVKATCLEKGDAAEKLLVIPRCLEKLKEVGVKIYGAPFVKVLSEDGNEINDIRVVKNWDRVVFASHKPAEESSVRVTITCLEKGDDAEELVVLLRSLEDLKHIGVKKYGASFTRVLNEEGNEINDIRAVKDGDQIVFSCQKRALEVMFKCLEKGVDVGEFMPLPSSIEELKGIGVKKYGAPFVRVLNKQGNEINDIRVLRDNDRIVFASTRESRVTITCPEKGDDAGKLMVLPRSFEELKWVGVKIYGASFVRVLTEKGNEINDINMVRDNDHIIFATYKRDEESNAQKHVEESNAHKWIEELNEHDKITCFAMLSEMWQSMIKGNEINDIDKVIDGTSVVFASCKGDGDGDGDEDEDEESNAQSNAQNWVEEFNEPDKINCIAMLSEMWYSMVKTYKYILFGK
ncbi:hypothetical protein SASPL_112860 [Salvia splendens]|uniref:KHA domain-containing protein n=1 Tax=Salvia splendens TaxID=180675 RepID=A0A8X9A4L1_SALSN|nr:uncharacterized protein LOC121801133 [Salvia splendens]KAG6428607.1 hypothetical protein SASPL_112860 [Salvia splendens]